MSITFYIGDYGPVPAAVTQEDGTTPALPLSATADIINLHTGDVVISGATCSVEMGTAAYIIPSGSPITATAARYAAYISVEIDATTKQTVQVPFDVLDKSSYLVVDRWRRKVEFAAPTDDSISDQEGRDWIDQAVDMLAGDYGFEYSSTLASITPTASRSTIEYVASVAALMARTAWWAGKGNWRDEEMSFDGTPFENEWARLSSKLVVGNVNDWFVAPDWTVVKDMYNRDKTDAFGIPDEPDDLFHQVWYRDS